MHVRAKELAVSGMMLALTVICMLLGSVIETSTLFFLAAASYFVGIIYREYRVKFGVAFYLAGVFLGAILAPNKLYVVSYAAMGFYILAIEIAWEVLGKKPIHLEHPEKDWKQRKILFWIIKYLIFNIMYLPAVIGFQTVLFAQTLPVWMLAGVIVAGQIGLLIYDMAYEYVQTTLWNKIRGKLFR